MKCKLISQNYGMYLGNSKSMSKNSNSIKLSDGMYLGNSKLMSKNLDSIKLSGGIN